MVKNLKRYRKQVERDQGKQEAQKYPCLSVLRGIQGVGWACSSTTPMSVSSPPPDGL